MENFLLNSDKNFPTLNCSIFSTKISNLISNLGNSLGLIDSQNTWENLYVHRKIIVLVFLFQMSNSLLKWFRLNRLVSLEEKIGIALDQFLTNFRLKFVCWAFRIGNATYQDTEGTSCTVQPFVTIQRIIIYITTVSIILLTFWAEISYQLLAYVFIIWDHFRWISRRRQQFP